MILTWGLHLSCFKTEEIIKGFDSAEDDRRYRLKLSCFTQTFDILRLGQFRQQPLIKQYVQMLWTQLLPTSPGRLESWGQNNNIQQEEQGWIYWIQQTLFMFELLGFSYKVTGKKERQNFVNSWTTQKNCFWHKWYDVMKPPQPAPSNQYSNHMVPWIHATSTNRAMKSEPNGSDKEVVYVPDRKQDFSPVYLNAWEFLRCITMSLPHDEFLLYVPLDLSITLRTSIRIYMICQAQYFSGSISPKLVVKTEHQPPSVPLNTTFFSHINVKQITLRAWVDFTPLTTAQASVFLRHCRPSRWMSRWKQFWTCFSTAMG